MDRTEAIATIEALYPADSEYAASAAIGQRLLEQAKREVTGWRTEPTEVLVRYAQLCAYEEERSIRELLRKTRV